MTRKQPPGTPPPPPVQKLRLRYAKRGRLRFTSHRDVARAFERALRRAEVPMAFSAGFSPHPKVSWVGAAPTGVASEAEYVEISVCVVVDPERLRLALDASLPAGIDILEVVEAPVGTNLPERVQASCWQLVLPEVSVAAASGAAAAFLAAEQIPVERVTKDGRRTLDARGPVVSLTVSATDGDVSCATLRLVVRHVTPAVRPDDVLSGLRAVANPLPPTPSQVTRLAQGPLDAEGEVGDPLAPDRLIDATGVTRPVTDHERVVVGATPTP